MPDAMPPEDPCPVRSRVVVVSGGTDGMGRALALARLERGDTVVVLGSSEEKGRRLIAAADALGAGARLDLIRTDLSSIAGTRAAIRDIAARHPVVDSLVLFANRQAPKRLVTGDGLEQTFALYYLSRHLLGEGLSALFRRSDTGVIVNVAGVGMTKGSIHWDDLQLERGYSMVIAQLQAGRANDLLGVAFAAQRDNPVRYVLYHPGFTRSGDLTPLPAPMRLLVRTAARLAARPIEESIAPIHDFIDRPPSRPLTAVDRGKDVPLTLPTLDPVAAQRLAEVTRGLVAARLA